MGSAPGVCLIVLAVAVIAAIASGPGERQSAARCVRRPPGVLTFSKDIVPIMFEHCAGCHRPGQSAPFSLLTYPDVKKRADLIAEVTGRRYMPPWLPEPGHGEFAGERRLTTDQIGLIQQWVEEGGVEGNPADLPPTPVWAGSWQLGEPDLVVTMPRPYPLVAEGKDVYRNFVVPVPIEATRYVRAVELQPGNPKIVHHAFIKVDRTRQSRRMEGEGGTPGFNGMNRSESAQMPDGHFLTWQPGKMPFQAPDGLAWTLERGADLVLEMHLRPSGKPETIQSRVGLYFTDKPATNKCFKLQLASYTIGIPAGSTNYAVDDDYVLPIDVDVLAVFPHAHYLCREMQGWATMPDGTKRWLIWIKEWDFNWQGDYRYRRPEFLPKGTKLSMRYTYDNSAANPRNPNHPPKRVQYGPQSSDEMAELWLQLLPRNKSELTVLAEDYEAKKRNLFMAYSEYSLRQDPNDVKAHTRLGLALLNQRRYDEARTHLLTAIRIEPRCEEAHYYLGLWYRQRKQFGAARQEFETTLQIDPEHYKAHGNLGLLFLEQGELASAEEHLRSALRLNPDDGLARESLDLVLKAKANPRR